MSFQKWLDYGWLRPHQPSRKEISDLLRIIALIGETSGLERNLKVKYM